jgi:hypothetical protein
MNVSPPTGKDIAELLLLCAPKDALTELELSETTIDEFSSFFEQYPLYIQISTTALALYYANSKWVKFNKSYSLVSKLYIAPEVIHSLIQLSKVEEYSEAENILGELAKNKSSKKGKHAINTRHNQAGGYREKKEKIRAIFATGKYGNNRTLCAQKECEALGISYSSARKHLLNTSNPT